VKTFTEVSEWCAGAAAQFGDPSVPVCQLFIRWRDHLTEIGGEDLVCGWVDGELVIFLGPEFQPLPMAIETGGYQLDDDGQLIAYGTELVTPGVWAISPSLNVEGAIHAFIVLYGIPDPAPWERRIVLL
jgi:hypothetical protein